MSRCVQFLTFLNLCYNTYQISYNIFHISFNVSILKPDKDHTKAFKPLLSLQIIFIFTFVTASVNFNCQHEFMTIKIYNKFIYGNLSMKLIP